MVGESRLVGDGFGSGMLEVRCLNVHPPAKTVGNFVSCRETSMVPFGFSTSDTPGLIQFPNVLVCGYDGLCHLFQVLPCATCASCASAQTMAGACSTDDDWMPALCSAVDSGPCLVQYSGVQRGAAQSK